ncbi:octaprenyl diphosphate synthase [Legionella qingyii]|uniref:Octaprenyl diphosphate synthase n=1 Tax=Legionella qingyii TaxID=2184757 RepID=A0A317U0Y3_9GAMM|nr:polyprenyl synthetase family protein [Legionella qingyii]PWY54125.1 octaprenyl diphosphate synthase [Legionella qingyii]PWY54457.1 octaprenyl diphosphate synthase [Legionella qingyii]RUR21099.1 octaprenyl diphosphate synthase [Legionella qingyii]RUR22111.1 octaprenyl diphosphate synthase [Legionella qingyii]
MAIDSIRALVSDDFDAVNTLIVNKIESQIGLIDDMSHHIIQSGGKRLRPLLVLLASNACGYQGKEHITLAAMVEFFHTATLLHDDVIDESTLRRGRQTANDIWGSKASILVGDYLFTQSIELIVDSGNTAVLKLFAKTALEISCGEVKQLSNRHNPALTFDEYFDVIRAKTALLFAAAACIGPMISNASKELQDSLYSYGLHLGNAFQLIDDALDYCSDAKTIGKNIGDDLADGKATLPLIHALQHGTELQKQQIMSSLKQGSLDFLPEILIALEETKAIEYTKKIAAQEIDKALSSLMILPDSKYKEALINLAQFALQRSY